MSVDERAPLLDGASASKKKQLSPTPSAISLAVGKVFDSRPRPWLKWTSFACSLHNCLWAGSILLFSLWSPVFQQKLGYSQLQVNAVAVASGLGQYIPVPLFGYIADQYGPSRLSLLAGTMFFLSYGLASWAFAVKASYWVMVMAFFGVGSGTASMHFAGLTAAAKNFAGRGIAVALPITCYGLSTFWQSQVISKLFRSEDGELLISGIFASYAVCLGVVGFIGFLGLVVIIPTAELDEETGEVTWVEEEEDKRLINAETRAFLKDQTMWWFALGMFLTTGPGESFMNNMGSLIQTITSEAPSVLSKKIDPANHISLIALSSAVARIISGSASDLLAPPVPNAHPHTSTVETPQKRFTISRLFFVFFFCLFMASGQLLVASGSVYENPDSFWYVTASQGASYGAMFTLIPTLTAIVWGTKNFGTNLGIMFMVPAVGSAVYGALWGVGYDGAAGDDGMCYGPQCAKAAFGVMAASTLVAILVYAWTWRGIGGWKSRGVVV